MEKIVSYFGEVLSEVVVFFEIRFEVVEFESVVFEELNEFPIAEADCGARGAALVAVVGVMPEKGTFGEGCVVAQERREVDSVVRGSGDIGDRGDGGEVVCADDLLVADGGGPSHAGPADDEGFADSAFVEPAFSGAEGEVAGGVSFGGAEAAVVGGEDDDGVVGEVQRVECVQYFPDGLIHGFDHACVDGVILNRAEFARAFLAPCVFDVEIVGFLYVFFQEIGSAHERGVYGVEGEICEEGFVLMVGDESCGFGCKSIGQMFALGSVF